MDPRSRLQLFRPQRRHWANPRRPPRRQPRRDQEVAKRPNELRRRLGYLPQDFGVYDNLTATEFLTYFAALEGVR